MGYLRLSERDRERLGCPERLPLDPFAVTNREAVALAKLGYPTPRLWVRALRSTPVDADGRPVDAGEAVDWSVDLTAWTGAVWVALRHAGIHTDLDTLEFEANGWSYHGDGDAEPAPKDDPAAAATGDSTS